MTLEEKYEQLKHNIRSKANEVRSKALVHYNGSAALYDYGKKNSFVLMTYDALQRNVPEMMWTNLGILQQTRKKRRCCIRSQIVNYLEKKK